METRLEKSTQLKRVLPKKKKDLCFEDLFELFKIKGYVRSGYFGNVYSIAFRNEDNNDYEIVPFKSMKCVRRKPEFLIKVTYDSKESRAEIRILKYIMTNVIPHTPHVFLYYNHVNCGSVQFRGKYKRGVAKSSEDWTYVKTGKGLITFMEYAGVTLEQYFKKPSDMNEQFIFLFQLLYTLCVFQKVKLLHYDIYPANVTVMDTGHTSPKIWKYEVKGKHYYVPVNQRIPVIIDFGQSEMQKKRLEVLLENNNDADMLIEMFRDYTHNMSMRAICSNMLRKINTKDMIRPRYFDYTNILSDFFKVFTNKPDKKTEVTWKL